MIDLDQLTFAYRGSPPIFARFTWHVAQGEAWAVIGPSGCGKTTLLYLLAGLLTPGAGALRIAAHPVQRPRPETGLILQDHGLLPWATVHKNARLGLMIRKFYGPDGRHAPRGVRLGKAEMDARVSYWLRRLGIAGLEEKYPAQLSGGQRQRVAIARTLAMQPDLLLMDEPFSALDVPAREDLQSLMLTLRHETALTSLIVTHNIEEAVYLGAHILVLRRPPNHHPQLIHNPDAGAVDYRNTPSFAARCEELRARLGGAA